MLIIVVLAVVTVLGLLDFTGIVAPIAKAAFLLIPAVFAISLVVGFASKRQNWFR